MVLGSLVRQPLWHASDWRESLRQQSAALRNAPLNARVAERAMELAAAYEAIEPDRSGAVEMYLVAWKAAHAHPHALHRARELCQEIGDLATAAKIARLEFQHHEDPRFLWLEGVLWLDTDEPDRAIRPLLTARKALPDEPSLAAALATAQREWPDVRRELERLVAEAERADEPLVAAASYLQAARILRLLGTDEVKYGQMLAAAFERAPRDDSTYCLYERYLVAGGDREKLLQLYRKRLQSAVSAEERVEDLRRAGTQLILRKSQVGVGLRLVDLALQECHRAELAEIPGHLAMLVLLREHSEEAGLLPSFVGLLARGLGRELPDHERLWLAMVGLDITWRQLGDAQAAAGYAAIVAELAPQHPILHAFLAGGGLPGRAEIAMPADGEPEHELDAAEYVDAEPEHELDAAAYVDAEPELELDPEMASVEVPDWSEPVAPVAAARFEMLDLSIGSPDDARALTAEEEEAAAPIYDLEPDHSFEPEHGFEVEVATAANYAPVVAVESDDAIPEPIPEPAPAPSPAVPDDDPFFDPEAFESPSTALYTASQRQAPRKSAPHFVPPVARRIAQTQIMTAIPLTEPAPVRAAVVPLISAPPAISAPARPAAPAIAARPAAPAISAPVVRPAISPPPFVPVPVPAPAIKAPPASVPAPAIKASPAPAPAPAPASAAPPKRVLAPLSLIPTSAMQALKQRGAAPLVVPSPPPRPPEAGNAATRIEVPVDVFLSTDADRDSERPPLAAVTRDLSASGMFVITTAPLVVGSFINVALELPGADALMVSKHRLRARVARHVEAGYGLEFIEPPAELRRTIDALAKRTP